MIKMGQTNTLDVLRVGDIAYVLTDEIEEIFLHKKQATRELVEGEQVDVFVYFDNLKRKTGTMTIPKLDINTPAFCEVVDVKPNLGAFLDVGLIKDLLMSRDDMPMIRAQWPQKGDKLFIRMKVSRNQMTAKVIPRFETMQFLVPERDLEINDKIKVQDQLFTVIGIVKSVPDIGGAFVFGDFALAGKQTLELLKLNNLGSFLNYEYKVRFNDGDNPKVLSKKIEQLFKNEKKVRLRYHEKSDGPLKRIIDNFSQFLSLVSISAMLIAGIGIANTLLSFINQNNMSIAVKKSLGFFSKDIKIVYYLQLLILLFIISTAAYSFSFFLVPIVDVYLSAGLGLNIEGSFSILNYFKVFSVGLLVLIIFSIPTINAIDQVKASNLFRNVFQNLQFYYSKKSIVLSLLLLSILISLFTIGSARPIYSLGYFGAFFVCLLVFYLLSNLIIKLFKSLKEHPNISIKVSVKNITQTKSITPITIMSLGLGVTLLLTLAFVGSNFKREIAKSIPELAPDYFLLVFKVMKDKYLKI